MKIILLSLISCLFIYSCINKQEKNTSNHPVLVVKGKTATSVYDIFSKIDVIPLETKEESLIRKMESFKYFDNKLYIFDIDQFAVFVFDGSGKYLYKIHRIGQGPGEYIYAYDFQINERNKNVELLTPEGWVLSYIGEEFIGKVTLPNPPSSYYKFESMNDSTYITSSLLFGREKPIYAVAKNGSYAHPNDYERSDPVVFNFGLHLFKYDDKVFFSENISDYVYEMKSTEYLVAYEWCFPKRMNNFLNMIKSTDENRNEKVNEYFEQFEKDPQNFYRIFDLQTDQYYYTLIDFGNKKINDKPDRYNVFYRKNDKKYYYFNKFEEGLAFRLIYTNDKFAIGELDPACVEDILNKKPESIKDIDILSGYRNDDNPILLKMYYR